MADQMQRSACMLVMEYVPGTALFTVNKPFQEEKLEQTAADLGRWASCAWHACPQLPVQTCLTANLPLFQGCEHLLHGLPSAPRHTDANTGIDTDTDVNDSKCMVQE